MSSHPAHASVADAAGELRAAGLRVTDSRRAVLSALRDHPHASADELFRRVAESVPQTSLQSVYNALADFVDAGLVRRIEPAGRPGLFELRVDDNHHHVICRACGRIDDVECAVGPAPCLTPSDAHGFTVETAEVTFWGLCPACATSSPHHQPEEGTP
ncbi:Fur family transcriptional regulator [Microbacterium terricola]|uniref:Transcriptional repressor n=1 Tax=Microbacterium terricola TaxID=344163 RepID=A0ABM8DX28_9MICO|nr:Fur family transcriptional regulator [Microbacterium terricola]UYK39220.1 transcriptional repressor [Microbacterium terricola]BDV30060.1 transcriptional repressor [Microbacterium terricola]